MTEVLRIIGDGRSVPDGPVPDGLSEDDLVTLFGWLVLLRTFDERAVALQRQGRIGTYPPFWGEEATQAGALYACRPDDWVFPSYRQNAIGILRGVPASVPLLYRAGLGGPYGFWNPRHHRVAPICIPVATHVSHAVGLAWAARIRRASTASLVWFGDGATSEGDWHEAMNFAAVRRVATVFFCVNNRWAISTPFERQTATSTIAEKAAAYGMPGVEVDGFDPLACWKATHDALERGRAGEGPTLLEAHCYRLGPHATADDPSRYRDESETTKWLPVEPVRRTAAFMRRIGILDDAREASAVDAARRTLARAVAELDAANRPGPGILFDHVYAGARPWTYDDAARELGAAGGV